MIKNNSEILFLFDAKRCNPNGDMDDENRPRMDKNNKINLVSDVRIKRYVRDYLQNYKNCDLFVTTDASESKNRVKQIIDRETSDKKPLTTEEFNKICKCIDIRLFGAVFGTKGGNDHITGPIQFTISESLNKVEIQKSKTITSSFSSGEGIGSDYRVVYSFIGTSASINSKIAEKSQMSEDDLKLFQESMVYAIPLCKTRSKTGQQPRLYLQVNTKDNVALKDLREFITLKSKENLLDITDVKLEISELIEYLFSKKEKIVNIEYWIDSKLKLYIGADEITIDSALKEFEIDKLGY